MRQKRAKTLLSNTAMEMSLTLEKNQWRLVYSQFLAEHIKQSVAKKLTGPWSPASTIGEPYPIYKPSSPHYDPMNSFCYAAKYHQLPKQQWITYVCSSFDFNAIVQDLWLYSVQIYPR